jgi:hypothetical protein
VRCGAWEGDGARIASSADGACDRRRHVGSWVWNVVVGLGAVGGIGGGRAYTGSGGGGKG